MSEKNNRTVESSYSIDERSNVSTYYPQLIRRTSSSTDRGYWDSKGEFILSCIGYSCGLGNFWRFPYLAYANGGGAFFIPYIILQVLVGTPMYFMELSLGQYSGHGPVQMFMCNPGAKGLGVSMIITCSALSSYYNVIIAYTLYYMFASFQTTLPWTQCSDEWVRRYNCYDRWGKGKSLSLCGYNTTSSLTDKCKCSRDIAHDFNISSCPSASISMSYDELAELGKTCPNLIVCTNDTHSPASIYFYREVVKRSGTLENIGTPSWKINLCALLSWIITIFCLNQGILSSGKVVYFTATFPYFVILALLVQAPRQDGSGKGMQFFLTPEWGKLVDRSVWFNAASQVLYSLGVSMGPIVTYGSYNKFNNNIYHDSVIISTVDLLTSFVAGLVVFSTLGSMAHDLGVEIEDVAEKSFGLVFVAYAEAIAQLPTPHFWGVFFFFMLFCLGIDSQFGSVASVLTFFIDEFRSLRRYRTFLVICISLSMFLVAIPLTTPGGLYVLNLVDLFCMGYPLMLICLFELIAISWVYGVRKLLQDIEFMIGFPARPVYFWMFTWAVIAPLIIMGIATVGLVQHKPQTYENGEVVSDLFRGVGWCIVVATLSPIPIFFVKAVYSAPGRSLWKKIVHASSPNDKWKSQEAPRLSCVSSLELNIWNQTQSSKVHPEKSS